MRFELRRVAVALVTVAAFVGSAGPSAGQATLGGIFKGTVKASQNFTAHLRGTLTARLPGKPRMPFAEGDQVPVGSQIFLHVDFENQADNPGIQMDVCLTVQGVTSCSHLYPDNFGTEAEVELKTPGAATIQASVTGKTSESFTRTVHVRAIPLVTVKDPGAGQPKLPGTQKLTVTATPGVAPLGGGATTSTFTFGLGTAVPDLKNMPLDAALRALKSAGFTAKVVVNYYRSDLRDPRYGQVFEQSPGAGTRVAKDAAITLKVYGKK